MFVDRVQELDFLNRVLTRRRPGPAQLLLIYGRCRVGKTNLLMYWAAQSGLPTTYWTAEKEPAALQRRKLYAAPGQHAHRPRPAVCELGRGLGIRRRYA